MNTKVRPWVTWTDFVLIGVAAVVVFVVDWAGYRSGLNDSWEGMFSLPLLLIIPLMGTTLLIRPLLNRKLDRSRHQLWIRPLLLGSGSAVCYGCFVGCFLHLLPEAPPWP